MKTPIIQYDSVRSILPRLRLQLAQFSDLQVLNGDFEHTWRTQTEFFIPLVFERFGQHVMVVGPRVSDAFCRTDLSATKSVNLKFPAPCFYVALVEPKWRTWGATSWRLVRGFYVVKGFRFDDQRKKKVPSLSFEIWCSGDEGHSFLSFAVGPYMNVGNLEEMVDGYETNRDWGGIENYKEIAAEEAQTVRCIFRLTINMLLYLNSDQPELVRVNHEAQHQRFREVIDRAKSPGKKKKLQRRIDNLPKTQVIYVGPQLEERMRQGHRMGERSAVTHHLVRPHWRRYWVGKKGEQKQVLRWIHLFERGSAKPERLIIKFREPTRSMLDIAL